MAKHKVTHYEDKCFYQSLRFATQFQHKIASNDKDDQSNTSNIYLSLHDLDFEFDIIKN